MLREYRAHILAEAFKFLVTLFLNFFFSPHFPLTSPKNKDEFEQDLLSPPFISLSHSCSELFEQLSQHS